MSLKEEELNLSHEFLSQGTMNVINQTIISMSPIEPPVKRVSKRNAVSDRDLSVEIPLMRRSGRTKKERFKVVDHHNDKMICLPKDTRFRVNLNYDKYCSNDLFVRIYPSATDHAFSCRPITCCQNHVKKPEIEVGVEMLERAMKSIFELHDPNVKFEEIELPGGGRETQISAVVRHFSPITTVDLVLKCYNTCHEAFKNDYPRLMFSVERFSNTENTYFVLSEGFILFKVCASPSRDCKSMALKRPFHQEIPPILPEKMRVTPNNTSSDYIELNGQRYYPKLVSGSVLKLLDSIHEYNQHAKLEMDPRINQIERLMISNLSNFFPDPREDIENKIERNKRDY